MKNEIDAEKDIAVSGKSNIRSRPISRDEIRKIDNLDKKVDEILKNCYSVVLRNVDYLCQENKLSQAKFCEQVLEGRVHSSQFSGFRNQDKDIPLRVIATIAAAFDLTIEDVCSKILGAEVDGNMKHGKFSRPVEEYGKYVGTYDLAYFDTSAPIGKSQSSTANAIKRGIMTVYPSKSDVGSLTFRAVAIFNCTHFERQQIVGAGKFDTTKDPSAVVKYYKQVLSNGEDSEDRLKCLYDGSINLSERMMEITMYQAHGSDVAHISTHNRAANSSSGKAYRGGLASMMSYSRGAEHMPCGQAVILASSSASHTANGGTLDFIQPEVLADKLYFTQPNIDFKDEVNKIIAYMKLLFSKDASVSPLDSLSDADKAACLESFISQQLTNSLRRNLLSCYKVSLSMDYEVYKLICKPSRADNKEVFV